MLQLKSVYYWKFLTVDHSLIYSPVYLLFINDLFWLMTCVLIKLRKKSSYNKITMCRFSGRLGAVVLFFDDYINYCLDALIYFINLFQRLYV